MPTSSSGSIDSAPEQMTPVDDRVEIATSHGATGRRPWDLTVVRLFFVALLVLLAGYMFMGRGFAHLGVPPVYVGEIVVLLGLLATTIAIVRLRLRVRPSALVWLLLAFMAWGVARTVPYLTTYGVDALRDSVLWAYALFALFMYILIDRKRLIQGMRIYGWVIPLFAIWLPIGWNIFVADSASINPATPGAYIPLVFFKAGDMAVHATGAVAFLVLYTATHDSPRIFAWRALLAVSFAWMTFLTATINRGALLATVVGLVVIAFFARRSANWKPVLVGGMAFLLVLLSPAVFTPLSRLVASSPPVATPASSTPAGSIVPSSLAPAGSIVPSSLAPAGSIVPSSLAPASSSPGSPLPTAAPPVGREPTVNQLLENVGSILGGSSEGLLGGSVAFRLAWWRTIFDYTVTGPYFWTGKGFGVNLADDDGFQPTADHSLRAPHNSHMTALARMGIPGFVLWVSLQALFAFGLLRSVLNHKRAGDTKIAATGAWILVYWTAMMVVTSFDPYLEGPQGGIWFWTLFGLGMVLIRHKPEPLRT